MAIGINFDDGEDMSLNDCRVKNYEEFQSDPTPGPNDRGALELLKEALDALNQIPNNRLIGRYKDTYSLVSTISKFLKNGTGQRKGKTSKSSKRDQKVKSLLSLRNRAK